VQSTFFLRREEVKRLTLARAPEKQLENRFGKEDVRAILEWKKNVHELEPEHAGVNGLYLEFLDAR
jgi:hypothetical protein